MDHKKRTRLQQKQAPICSCQNKEIKRSTRIIERSKGVPIEEGDLNQRKILIKRTVYKSTNQGDIANLQGLEKVSQTEFQNKMGNSQQESHQLFAQLVNAMNNSQNVVVNGNLNLTENFQNLKGCTCSQGLSVCTCSKIHGRTSQSVPKQTFYTSASVLQSKLENDQKLKNDVQEQGYIVGGKEVRTRSVETIRQPKYILKRTIYDVYPKRDWNRENTMESTSLFINKENKLTMEREKEELKKRKELEEMIKETEEQNKQYLQEIKLQKLKQDELERKQMEIEERYRQVKEKKDLRRTCQMVNQEIFIKNSSEKIKPEDYLIECKSFLIGKSNPFMVNAKDIIPIKTTIMNYKIPKKPTWNELNLLNKNEEFTVLPKQKEPLRAFTQRITLLKKKKETFIESSAKLAIKGIEVFPKSVENTAEIVYRGKNCWNESNMKTKEEAIVFRGKLKPDLRLENQFEFRFNGRERDWNILNNITRSKPFTLSFKRPKKIEKNEEIKFLVPNRNWKTLVKKQKTTTLKYLKAKKTWDLSMEKTNEFFINRAEEDIVDNDDQYEKGLTIRPVKAVIEKIAEDDNENYDPLSGIGKKDDYDYKYYYRYENDSKMNNDINMQGQGAFIYQEPVNQAFLVEASETAMNTQGQGGIIVQGSVRNKQGLLLQENPMMVQGGLVQGGQLVQGQLIQGGQLVQGQVLQDAQFIQGEGANLYTSGGRVIEEKTKTVTTQMLRGSQSSQNQDLAANAGIIVNNEENVEGFINNDGEKYPYDTEKGALMESDIAVGRKTADM